MTDEEFADYYERYKGVIARIARKLARRDDELYKDLKQEGAFALLRLIPSKARVNKDAWIRQAVKFRMIDYLRKTDPESYESLQDHIENGGQVTEDPEDGEVILLLPFQRNGRRPPRQTPHDDTDTRLVKQGEDWSVDEEET